MASTLGTVVNSVGTSGGLPVNNVTPDPIARPLGPGGSALAVGDVVFILVTLGTATNTDGTATVAGFTQVDAVHDQGSPGTSSILLRKTITNPGSEPSTYTISITGLNSANKALAAAWVARGLNSAALGSVAANKFVVSTSTANRGPIALTLSGAGKTWRLFWIAGDRAASTFTSDSDVEMMDYNSGTSPNTAHALYTTAADVGPGTYTKTPVASTASSVGVGMLVAFETGSLPPTLSVTEPANNIVDLRGSTSGDGSSLTFPTPVKVSGPTLTSSSLVSGLWLFSQDATSDAVYTVSASQTDGQSSSQNVTIEHLPAGDTVNISAPLRPTGGGASGTTWI